MSVDARDIFYHEQNEFDLYFADVQGQETSPDLSERALKLMKN